MKSSLLKVSLIAAWVTTAAADRTVADGTFTGKITLKGQPPHERAIDMSGDPECAKMYSTPVKTRWYVVGPNGELANVFVFVKSGPAVDGKTFEPPKVKVTLQLKDCLFDPYVFGVQVNQEIEITSSDLKILHFVRATQTENNPESLKGLGDPERWKHSPPLQMKVTHKFEKPEVGRPVRFKDDVHPWEFAWCFVVPHPFFEVTRETGAYKLSGLSPGKYAIEAWHQRCGTQTVEVAVGAGETKTQDFTFEPKK